MLRFADFELDQRRAELRGPDGAPIRLRPKTFLMLHTLAANAGRVVGKQELMDAVWADIHVSEDSLFQCIREIRTALGDDDRSLVRVVSGRGYLFDTEVVGEPRLPQRDSADGVASPPVPEQASAPPSGPARTRPTRIMAAVAVLAVVALCAAVLLPRHIGEAARPAIAVLPIVVTGSGIHAGVTAAGVADRLVEGLSGIETIRVLAPTPQGAANTADADYLLAGELKGDGDGWTLAARLIRAGTTEVAAVAGATADNDADESLRQLRLAAGVGGPLARSLNLMMQGAPAGERGGAARVAIEQAMASINQTSPERFAAAQEMLERALAAEPGNVDLQVALAGLQTRGIQMLWYDPVTGAAAETRARALLEGALATRPRSIAVLEAYCRFLAATNNFVESLVACARVLSFDPWNGSALYQLGLTQLHLGRFDDALASFRQAYRFDTPSVSRWTWLLGIGWANLMLGDDAEAARWIERSIAITPASGRSHLLLAVAYQRLGRVDDARAAMARALELRPGSNSVNVSSPTRNASPVFLEGVEALRHAMVAAGLPEG